MKTVELDEESVRIPCVITEEDIQTMLDRFDSGMADLTTSNAIALAMRRELGPDIDIRVIGDGAEGEFFCLLEGRKSPLPPEVSEWLSGCFRGIPAQPIQFEICLPGVFLKSVKWGESLEATSPDQSRSIAA